MTYQLTIEQKPTFLHATVTGQNSRATVTQYLHDVLEACRARNCFRVLIEERLEGPRLGTVDVFKIAADEGRKTLGIVKAIAFVDVNAQGDLMQFAETVAANRGVPVRVFRTVPEAEQWLVEISGGSGGP
jgi:hypothetical protein